MGREDDETFSDKYSNNFGYGSGIDSKMSSAAMWGANLGSRGDAMASSFATKPGSVNAGSLAARFKEIREMSMRITRNLSAEDHMLQSMPEASPAKWHLAHTTWFFETFVLLSHSSKYKPFHRDFQYVFNSYYKQLGGHPYRGARGLMSRPSLERVHEYRRAVDVAMLNFLENAPAETLELIEIGLNHEQQHQELILTDVKHGLWSGPLNPEPKGAPSSQNAATTRLDWIEFDGGIYSIGYDGDGFAFDNEGPRHEVLLKPFQLATRLVTNGEYLEFMQDAGYQRPELWLSDGWDAVNAQNWSAPLYWEKHEGQWWHFHNEGLEPCDLTEPVCHISYFEADAFARWSGARLPLESEWEVVAGKNPSRGTLLDDEVFHPQSAKGEGFQQAFGDVWEWTASPYVGYPGFKPAAGAVGEYNGKFMCNQLVLRGGSCATPASHIRASYRNFFPPQTRWQFSGLRLAK